MAGGAEEQYTYDPRNRLTTHTKGGVVTPYVYDDAGNLLRDGNAAYEYDGFNRAVKADTFDGNVQVNRYDAEGLRYEMEENGRLVQFIFRQQEAICEQSEKETLRLIRGYDLIASDAQSARTYYHYASDEMGSTTHIVGNDGKVENHYAYDAFGNVTEQQEAVPNRFKFNGQQLDPITGQYYLRARFYNPVVARFTQEDVYRGDGLNLYAYCHNNPVIYVDPSGYNACSSMDAQLAQQRAATGNINGPITVDPSGRAFLPDDPHIYAQNMVDAGLAHQGKNGQWYMPGRQGSLATPVTMMPALPKAATPGATPQIQINYQRGMAFDQHVQQTRVI